MGNFREYSRESLKGLNRDLSNKKGHRFHDVLACWRGGGIGRRI